MSSSKKKSADQKKAQTAKTLGSDDRSTFAKAESVIARRNQNGTVILMRLDKASSFYKIDGIAAEVWGCLEAPKSLELLLDFFGKRYPAKAKLRQEMDSLLKKLQELELVSRGKAPADPAFPLFNSSTKKPSDFGKVQEFDLEQIEAEVLNESVYLDVFAGSDLRLKTEVKPIRGALSKVVQLDGVTHRWKEKRKGVHAGLIAQQVALQMPELVRKDLETGALAINYQKLNSYLVEAIKELEKRVRSLEAKLS